MGNKIIKWMLAIPVLGIIAAFALSGADAFQIPEATMQIAAKQMLNTAQTSLPSSEVIRVGIGNQTFSSYNYKNLSIYGTDEVFMYDDQRLVGKFAPKSDIEIYITDEYSFDIYSNGHKIDNYSGPMHFVCNKGLLGVTDLKRAGKPALYHGAFEIVRSQYWGFFNLVNLVEVEEYLKGVVPNEMPVKFGLEALKAQSVTARNYVLSPRVKSSPNYDVVDSVASQVYYGANTEKEIANQAVTETEGIVAIYDWELILAQYSSTAGGYTEDFAYAFSDPKTKEFPSKEKPYLKAAPDIEGQPALDNESEAFKFYSTTPDSFDIKSPYYRWTREWLADELVRELDASLPKQSATGFITPQVKGGQSIGKINNISVVQRGKSGKIIELLLDTTSGQYHIFKELVIRRTFTKEGKALPSANVVFVPKFASNGKLLSVKAYGGGYGHGVGMSQYGAGFMAQELSKNYKQILFRYYTDISLGTKPVLLNSDNPNSVQTFFLDSKKDVYLVVDNKVRVKYIDAVINGKEQSFELHSTFFGDCINRIDISKFIRAGRNVISLTIPDQNKELKAYVEIGRNNDENE